MIDSDKTNEAVRRLMDQYTEIARLAGALAHEIRNPLSTIRLNMELLAEDLDQLESPLQTRMLKRVDVTQRECGRLQNLLDDFLNYAKVRTFNFVAADINTEITDLLDFFSLEAKESEIEIQRYLDSELPPIQIDPEAFRGAMLNLLLNAKQAMPTGGQLIVRTELQGERVAIYLIDTGCGMDEKTASQMFETFYSTKPGGSGLGLPTTHKIIEGHGGRISVQSEVGRGTQFVVELPSSAQIEE